MISAQVESLAEGLEEIKPLLPAHWEELGLYKDRMPLDPQYDEYLRREALGSLIYVTLRNHGELVGYFIGFITPGLHYQQTLTCTMDILLVRPEYRGMDAGSLLLQTVKAELKRRGVKMWWVGSKNHKPIEGFFRILGFTHEESYFAMWLDDDPVS